MKKYLKIAIILTLLVFVSAGFYVSANSPKTDIFTGANGKEIYVRTNYAPAEKESQSGEVIEKKDVKVGDIIDIDGVKEIVIAVGEDGRFVSQIYDDYLTENP